MIGGLQTSWVWILKLVQSNLQERRLSSVGQKQQLTIGSASFLHACNFTTHIPKEWSFHCDSAMLLTLPAPCCLLMPLSLPQKKSTGSYYLWMGHWHTESQLLQLIPLPVGFQRKQDALNKLLVYGALCGSPQICPCVKLQSLSVH